MYESILRVATQDPQFRFALKSTPLPPTFEYQFKFRSFTSGLVCLYTAVAYSALLSSVANYLVNERLVGLKHLQVISGMQRKVYWIGNFVVDLIKVMITIIATILCFISLDMGMESAVWTYLAMPFGALPFTYVTSFLFSTESGAQTSTMFFHFSVLACLSNITYFLRITPGMEIVGDYFNYICRVLPTYPLASTVFISGNQ